jgi:hypothetical protein
MATERATEEFKAWERATTDKATTMTLWQQIANYHLPNRSDYLVQKWPGQKRMTYIYDASPVWALDQHAAGVHSLLTSNSLIWAWLRTFDERINNDDAARDWLDDASMVLFRIFSSARNNFASQSYEVFLDTGSIGSATMFALDSPKNDILFTTRHMKEIVWFENDEDRVDGVIRNWEWTAKQAVQAWGDKVKGKVRDAFNAGNDQNKFMFLHSIRPRIKRDVQRADRQNMPWSSCYISVADKEEIDEGGFREFPAFCPRFSKASGEIYGRGPGSIAQPDTQMLNDFKKLLLKSAQKIIDPPLQIPDNGFLLQIKTVPGSFNFYRSGLPQTDRISPIETKGNIPIGIELFNAVQQQIMRTFYVDMLHMPIDPSDPGSEGKGITATYWLQRRDKEMMMIAPMLARMQAEFLGPAIDRVFAMLWRKSKKMGFGPGSPFKPPPAILSGRPLQVEYVSPIALAQKSTQMDGIQRLLQIQQALRQIDNTSPITIDGEAILRIASRDFNAPIAALKSPERMQQEAQARAQAEAALHNTQIAQGLAGAAKDGTAALGNLKDAQSADNENNQENAA